MWKISNTLIINTAAEKFAVVEKEAEKLEGEKIVRSIFSQDLIVGVLDKGVEVYKLEDRLVRKLYSWRNKNLAFLKIGLFAEDLENFDDRFVFLRLKNRIYVKKLYFDRKAVCIHTTSSRSTKSVIKELKEKYLERVFDEIDRRFFRTKINTKALNLVSGYKVIKDAIIPGPGYSYIMLDLEDRIERVKEIKFKNLYVSPIVEEVLINGSSLKSCLIGAQNEGYFVMYKLYEGANYLEASPLYSSSGVLLNFGAFSKEKEFLNLNEVIYVIDNRLVLKRDLIKNKTSILFEAESKKNFDELIEKIYKILSEKN